MDKKTVESALKELKEKSPKRNFVQSVDLIVTFRDLNLKNPEEQVDFFASLPHSTGKKARVAAIVGPELYDKAKEVCDTVITQEDFEKYKDKKEAKKLANSHDYFIAQADIMPKVAGAFGRVLGPRNKMPNPKLGSVLPAKGQVEPLYVKLQSTARITAKKSPMIQVKVGNASMKDSDVVENALQVFNQVVHHLPRENSNVKDVYLKLTMSKPVKIK